MPEYSIIYDKDFLRDLKRIMKGGDKKIKGKVANIIEQLKTEPHKKRSGLDIKLISPRKEAVYRVRIGKYRMVYEIDETRKKVFLTMIFLKTSEQDYR